MPPIADSVVARVVGIDTNYVQLRAGSIALPQQVAIIGQAATAMQPVDPTPYKAVSAFEVGTKEGFGSPLHLAALAVLPVSGGALSGVPVFIFPMDNAGGAAAAVASIDATSPASAITLQVVCAGIATAPITIAAAGDAQAAITAAVNATTNFPMTALSGAGDIVDFTSKWSGLSANDLNLALVVQGGGAAGMVIVQPMNGSTSPDVSVPLALIGDDQWFTMLINCLEPTDSAALDEYNTWGEGRWDQLIRKPAVVATGSASATEPTAIAAARTLERTNALVWSRQSSLAIPEARLPLQIAAAAVAVAAAQAHVNPAKDYHLQVMPGLAKAADSIITHAERDSAVKAGISTVEYRAGQIVLSDFVTMYRPPGEVPPAYRRVVTIVKISQTLFNLDLEFEGPKWAGAPLIPKGQTNVNPDARTPEAAIAAVAGILDSLALNAIVSDPNTAKQTITADIDGGNPNRLNVAFTYTVSGSVVVIDIAHNFGFFFGEEAA